MLWVGCQVPIFAWQTIQVSKHEISRSWEKDKQYLYFPSPFFFFFSGGKTPWKEICWLKLLRQRRQQGWSHSSHLCCSICSFFFKQNEMDRWQKRRLKFPFSAYCSMFETHWEQVASPQARFRPLHHTPIAKKFLAGLPWCSFQRLAAHPVAQSLSSPLRLVTLGSILQFF